MSSSFSIIYIFIRNSFYFADHFTNSWKLQLDCRFSFALLPASILNSALICSTASFAISSGERFSISTSIANSVSDSSRFLTAICIFLPSSANTEIIPSVCIDGRVLLRLYRWPGTPAFRSAHPSCLSKKHRRKSDFLCVIFARPAYAPLPAKASLAYKAALRNTAAGTR